MKVQELLSSKDKWTQGALAKNIDNYLTWTNSPDAVKWCLEGAIRKCYPTKVNEILNKIEDKEGIFVSRFNDTHKYEEVMELVRRLDL